MISPPVGLQRSLPGLEVLRAGPEVEDLLDRGEVAVRGVQLAVAVDLLLFKQLPGVEVV